MFSDMDSGLDTLSDQLLRRDSNLYVNPSNSYMNIPCLQKAREIQKLSPYSFIRKVQMTREKINRLHIEKQLVGHEGCVNCIQFSKNGRYLLSGSDDLDLILWDVHRQKKLKNITTTHNGNIFSIQFMPQSNDELVVSGAGDGYIEVRAVETGNLVHQYRNHCERVKGIATHESLPYIFFSASEDGTVSAYDTRLQPKTSDGPGQNVLVNLSLFTGSIVECKCLAINPLQPELLAVGANDYYVRIYDRRMIKPLNLKTKPCNSLFLNANISRVKYDLENMDPLLPTGCVDYYVPGQLPSKKSYMTSFATTYLSYSQDGQFLLANLGGDRVYMYNTRNQTEPIKYPTYVKKKDDPLYCESAPLSKNSICNGRLKNIKMSPDCAVHTLTGDAQIVKEEANDAFKSEDYLRAIQLYNMAISIAPNSPTLYSNRAAALLKREWRGDIYNAMRDCFCALQLNPLSLKAQFRLVKCLISLKRFKEAMSCLEEFKIIQERTKSKADKETKTLDAEIIKQMKQHKVAEESENTFASNNIEQPPHVIKAISQEETFRSHCMDYERDFKGNCNFTTDIMQAVFLGSEEKYIAAGSDDGKLFIWDRNTTNLVRVLQGDENVVNCVQSHPYSSIIATSGIDSSVKIWTPKPDNDENEEDWGSDIKKVSYDNEAAGNFYPTEWTLMNLGIALNL